MVVPIVNGKEAMMTTSTTRRRICLLAAGAAICVGLAGCGTAAEPATDQAAGPGGDAATQQGGQNGQQGGQNGQQGGPGAKGEAKDSTGAQYNIEQAISDKAQENTIAFDALGFLTGSLGADSFFPPGKVADFWGFQYLRDNDLSQMGHNTDFLTKASMNMLYVLTDSQRSELIALAKSQVGSIQDYGYKRFVLMKAFRRLLDGDLPAGTTSLDEEAVAAFSAELYQLDGQISYERAQVMGPILAGLSSEQKSYLDAMVGKGMASAPDVEEPAALKGLSRDEKEAVMTYSGDMFSWYAGSIEADVYFCPERQGTYFGSFYLKDAPAVGNPGYSIDTTITGNLGAALLSKLDATQAALITGLVDAQRPYLTQIVDTRRSVSTELRKFLAGGTADEAGVDSLMAKYGELDGKIIYGLATAFAKVGQALTSEQKTQLQALRTQLLGDLSLPGGAYLFSTPIAMPTIPDTDFLFG
jgi:Spy/CpxP family protein refolding chaperone